MPIIEAKKLSAYRGTTLALREVSFSIDQGQHTAIVGPNGAGKSTLLKLLSRELYPAADCGSLHLFQHDRWNVWELRSRLGIVSPDLQSKYTTYVSGQDVVLSGFSSTIGNVQLAKLSGAQVRLAEKVMAELNIESLGKKKFGQMSTGEQRRCLIARALVNDPEVLIFDEPTTGLDLPSRFLFFEIVARLMRRQKTIVMVTHHVEDVPPEMNQVVLLKEGRLFGAGDKQSWLTSERLSELFGVAVKVVCDSGFYFLVAA